MTRTEQIRFIAEKVMGWHVYPLSDPNYNNPAEHRLIENILGKWNYFAPGKSIVPFDPFTSPSDAFQVEDAIGEMPVHIRQKYVTAIYNGIVGAQEIVGTLRVHWGMLHATPEQRSLAAISAMEAQG